MQTRVENLVKDYLAVAVLLAFMVSKLPLEKVMINNTNLNLNIADYQGKKALLLNSVLKSGVRLLDIKLELESSDLARSGDLIARTKFDSFGNVPTLINLNYVITDSSGREVYREIDEVEVETEKVFTKDFKKLNLKQGSYTLTLNTVYNSDVKDNFKQSFVVRGLSRVEKISWGVIIFGILVMTYGVLKKVVIAKAR